MQGQESPVAGRRCRVGIDVGGTFTDFVLIDRDSSRTTRFKQPSEPADPSLSIERGLPELLAAAGCPFESVELVVHGTTLLVNAIIQRRGAALALVVSTGNRGILEIGRANLAHTQDFTLRKETPLVPRDRVFEINARLGADGTVISRPDPSELDRVALGIRESGATAVAVQLLHSFRYPDLERAVADALAARLPAIPVTRSAEIWPELGEFERSLVALMNAYVQPIMGDYLERLKGRLDRAGLRSPLFITASNGGTVSVASAARQPIHTVLSGPASGVNAAAQIAAAIGEPRAVTFDMGGTSADLAIIDEMGPSFTTDARVGEFPLVLPVLEVTAIGAGGGSIVWVDRQGVLKIGPDSAGAVPGPVCYGRGGTQPTMTDCYLVLGYLDPDGFLGGRLRLDRTAARASLELIAETIGIEGVDRAERAAEAAVSVASALMASELQKSLARRGEEAADYALMAFGGAGPTHANHLAAECDMTHIVVPMGSSTFCALGAVLAEVMRDYVHSELISLKDGETADRRLAAILSGLQAEALRWIASEGDLIGEPDFQVTLEMRYEGQAFELQVPVDETLRQKPDRIAITDRFHVAHEKLYGFRDGASGAEITGTRLRIVGRMPRVPLAEAPAGSPGSPEQRQVFCSGSWRDFSVYPRGRLGRDAAIAGPAIIEQTDTTVVVLPGWAGRVDRIGNLVIEPVDGDAR